MSSLPILVWPKFNDWIVVLVLIIAANSVVIFSVALLNYMMICILYYNYVNCVYCNNKSPFETWFCAFLLWLIPGQDQENCGNFPTD